MRKIISLVITAALLASSATLLTGCIFDTPLTPEQNGWVKQLEEEYPDDTFTVVGHTMVSPGFKSPTCVSVTSENFPGVDVQIYKYEGELVSNYPNYYHEEAVRKYYQDMIAMYFDCDYSEVEGTDRSDKPLEYMSDREFIDKCVMHHYSAVLYYEAGHDYPEEDEIISKILDYLSQIHTDNDRGHLINFYFARPGADKPKTKGSDLAYQTSLHEGRTSICRIKDNSFIYKGEDLSSLLASRK